MTVIITLCMQAYVIGFGQVVENRWMQRPIISFELNKIPVNSTVTGLPLQIEVKDSLHIGIHIQTWVFTNIGLDTLSIRNVVPWEIKPDQLYITGHGDHPLSRTHLFIPNKVPLNIIVPDNLWHLGFNTLKWSDSSGMYALARRADITLGLRSRFETKLFPGGSVRYHVYMESYKGDWHDALKQCFQQRMLFDLERLDDQLYQRPDLQWIKKVKMIHLIMAWDERLYTRKNHRYQLEGFIKRAQFLYGGDDAIGLWPTWPALGIDPRNQWDMYRDLPGGIQAIKELAQVCHSNGIKFFLCYNPWDQSTRSEEHLTGMQDMIRRTNADGVVLDTRGSSSKELQLAADQVKPGVIMYSEGMAIPKDMENIISGRVHNALYYPPLLNLNKLIKADFGIFRVVELYKEPIRRELHTALFNGYGIEFNVFHPGNRADESETYSYLGNIVRPLRSFSDNFNSSDWQPLLPTAQDQVYVNYWPGKYSDVYTVYNTLPQGYTGHLFKSLRNKQHWVDVWHHEEIKLNQDSVPVRLEPFSSFHLGTNNEGSVAVIVGFDSLLRVHLQGDLLTTSADVGQMIKIWAGSPSYDKAPHTTSITKQTINLTQLFPDYEGTYVIQLFLDSNQIDERVLQIAPGTPRLISSPQAIYTGDTAGMIKVPGGSFIFNTKHGDEFIPYPVEAEGKSFEMHGFYMDRHPVTNQQFETFLKKSKYKPQDTSNFLKLWSKKKLPDSLKNHPVVYISIEDARAYASWAGKRLPTELEWQYAGQTSERRTWPWQTMRPINRKAEIVNETLTHYKLEGFDSTLCNIGTGKMDAVGSYPSGANPLGIQDLVGSVWQMTNDEYKCGKYRYSILKGGSYFKPESSWWYVQGGPQELAWRQMLLQVSAGFERKSTVGFRCVRDIRNEGMKE